MKIDKLRADLVEAQTKAVWAADCDFSRYRFWFESDWLLSSYGDMLSENKFNQTSDLRTKCNYTYEQMKNCLGCVPSV